MLGAGSSSGDHFGRVGTRRPVCGIPYLQCHGPDAPWDWYIVADQTLGVVVVWGSIGAAYMAVPWSVWGGGLQFGLPRPAGQEDMFETGGVQPGAPPPPPPPVDDGGQHGALVSDLLAEKKREEERENRDRERLKKEEEETREEWDSRGRREIIRLREWVCELVQFIQC